MNALWLGELAREGVQNLLRHKMRSVLSLSGVVFGVAAVIAMLAIGEGAQRTVLREIEGLGLNNIILDSVQPPEASRAPSTDSRKAIRLYQYGLTFRDAAQFGALLPQAALSVAHQVRQKVYCGSTRVDARVLGVEPSYFSLFRSDLVEGRRLADLDDAEGRRVAVMTQQAAGNVRRVGGVVGRPVRIGQDYFEVVGVVRMPSRLASSTVFVPYRTARRLFGMTSLRRESGSMEWTRTEVGQMVLRLDDERQIPEAAQIVDRVLRKTHEAPDVSATVPLDLLASKQRAQRVLNLVLIAIAAISLLVGGIGIMNIMLAVVTERIPEIGVRRALGASRRDILFQFLAETVVLSTAGGILGCALGFGSVPVAALWTGWQGVVTPAAVAASLAVSWLVGVVFGLAPALRAARLDPVECLRYE